MKNGIDVSVIIPAYNAAETSVSLVTKTQWTPLGYWTYHCRWRFYWWNWQRSSSNPRWFGSFSLSRPIKVSMPPEMLLSSLAPRRIVIFLDADDDIADGFIEKRWQAVSTSQADASWSLMAGIPVLTNIEERFTKSSPMVRLCQVINGLDTVLHTANGRIICGCRWSGPSYVRQHSLRFQSGRSHKDIF